MRWSELGAKEIINLYDGHRLGLLGRTELLLNEETGEIEAIVVPARGGLWQQRRELSIPWSAVRRVGPEVLIVEMGPEGRRALRRREED
jgi:YlmC/YmxH family sporulation protein